MNKWRVNVKGSHDRAGEISVIKNDNNHGFISYGWFDENKILIAGNGGPCHYTWTKEVWIELVLLAERIADRLNNDK